MPERNIVPIGDVIVEFVSCTEVVIARLAVIARMLLLVPVPLSASMVPLVGSVVVSLVRSVMVSIVRSVVTVLGMSLVPIVTAMAVVVMMTGIRPRCAGCEQQDRGGSNDDRSEPFRSNLGVSGH
jgi:hypothetical protein